MATTTMLHSLPNRPWSAWLAVTDDTQGNAERARTPAQKSQLHSLSMPAVAALHVFALELDLYHVVLPHGKTSGRPGEEIMAALEDAVTAPGGGDG